MSSSTHVVVDGFTLPVLQPSGRSTLSLWLPPRHGIWRRKIESLLTLLCLDQIVFHGLKKEESTKLVNLHLIQYTDPSNVVEEGSDPSDKEVIAKANREWDRRNFVALKILFNTISDKIQISDELAVISQRNAFLLWSAIVGTGLFDII